MDSVTDVHRCNKCATTKPASEFYLRGGRPSSPCKNCVRERSRNYYAANREAQQAKTRAWRERNREYLRTKAREYYEANKEAHRERSLRWSRENPEYYRKYNQRWYAENRESRKAQISKYWADRPVRRAEINRLAESARRARMAENTTIDFTLEQLEARLAVYGGKCWICRSAPGIEIDHVKPTRHGGPHMLANLRPACRSCNSAKGSKWPFDPAPYRVFIDDNVGEEVPPWIPQA